MTVGVPREVKADEGRAVLAAFGAPQGERK